MSQCRYVFCTWTIHELIGSDRVLQYICLFLIFTFLVWFTVGCNVVHGVHVWVVGGMWWVGYWVSRVFSRVLDRVFDMVLGMIGIFKCIYTLWWWVGWWVG